MDLKAAPANLGFAASVSEFPPYVNLKGNERTSKSCASAVDNYNFLSADCPSEAGVPLMPAAYLSANNNENSLIARTREASGSGVKTLSDSRHFTSGSKDGGVVSSSNGSARNHEGLDVGGATKSVIRFRDPKRQVGTAYFDYTAKENDELSLKRGSVVEIIRHDCEEDGWLLAKVDNKKGMVPKNYIGLVGSQPAVVKAADLQPSTFRIGTGGFADVFRGTFKGQDVALKIPRQHTGKTTKVRETLEREALIFCRLRHKNIVGFHGISLNPLLLVLELCEGGTLFSLCRRMKSSDALTVLYWAKQVASAMQHLHSRDEPLVHADLKADNVLIKERPCECGLRDANWKDATVATFTPSGVCCKCSGVRLDALTLKVTDFGLSRNLSSKRESFSGSVSWMPPEVIEKNDYSMQSDVWSFGVFLWEILSCKIPFSNYDYHVIMFAIVKRNKTLPVPISCPDEIRNVFSSCWRHEASQRPSFAHIYQLLETAERKISPTYKWDLKDDGQKSATKITLDEIERQFKDGKINIFKWKPFFQSKPPPTPAARTSSTSGPHHHRVKKSKVNKNSIGEPQDFRHNVSVRPSGDITSPTLSNNNDPLSSIHQEKLFVVQYPEPAAGNQLAAKTDPMNQCSTNSANQSNRNNCVEKTGYYQKRAAPSPRRAAANGQPRFYRSHNALDMIIGTTNSLMNDTGKELATETTEPNADEKTRSTVVGGECSNATLPRNYKHSLSSSALVTNGTNQRFDLNGNVINKGSTFAWLNFSTRGSHCSRKSKKTSKSTPDLALLQVGTSKGASVLRPDEHVNAGDCGSHQKEGCKLSRRCDYVTLDFEKTKYPRRNSEDPSRTNAVDLSDRLFHRDLIDNALSNGKCESGQASLKMEIYDNGGRVGEATSRSLGRTNAFRRKLQSSSISSQSAGGSSKKESSASTVSGVFVTDQTKVDESVAGKLLDEPTVTINVEDSNSNSVCCSCCMDNFANQDSCGEPGGIVAGCGDNCSHGRPSNGDANTTNEDEEVFLMAIDSNNCSAEESKKFADCVLKKCCHWKHTSHSGFFKGAFGGSNDHCRCWNHANGGSGGCDCGEAFDDVTDNRHRYATDSAGDHSYQDYQLLPDSTLQSSSCGGHLSSLSSPASASTPRLPLTSPPPPPPPPLPPQQLQLSGGSSTPRKRSSNSQSVFYVHEFERSDPCTTASDRSPDSTTDVMTPRRRSGNKKIGHLFSKVSNIFGTNGGSSSPGHRNQSFLTLPSESGGGLHGHSSDNSAASELSSPSTTTLSGGGGNSAAVVESAVCFHPHHFNDPTICKEHACLLYSLTDQQNHFTLSPAPELPRYNMRKTFDFMNSRSAHAFNTPSPSSAERIFQNVLLYHHHFNQSQSSTVANTNNHVNSCGSGVAFPASSSSSLMTTNVPAAGCSGEAGVPSSSSPNTSRTFTKLSDYPDRQRQRHRTESAAMMFSIADGGRPLTMVEPSSLPDVGNNQCGRRQSSTAITPSPSASQSHLSIRTVIELQSPTTSMSNAMSVASSASKFSSEQQFRSPRQSFRDSAANWLGFMTEGGSGASTSVGTTSARQQSCAGIGAWSSTSFSSSAQNQETSRAQEPLAPPSIHQRSRSSDQPSSSTAFSAGNFGSLQRTPKLTASQMAERLAVMHMPDGPVVNRSYVPMNDSIYKRQRQATVSGLIPAVEIAPPPPETSKTTPPLPVKRLNMSSISTSTASTPLAAPVTANSVPAPLPRTNIPRLPVKPPLPFTQQKLSALYHYSHQEWPSSQAPVLNKAEYDHSTTADDTRNIKQRPNTLNLLGNHMDVISMGSIQSTSLKHLSAASKIIPTTVPTAAEDSGRCTAEDDENFQVLAAGGSFGVDTLPTISASPSAAGAYRQTSGIAETTAGERGAGAREFLCKTTSNTSSPYILLSDGGGEGDVSRSGNENYCNAAADSPRRPQRSVVRQQAGENDGGQHKAAAFYNRILPANVSAAAIAANARQEEKTRELVRTQYHHHRQSPSGTRQPLTVSTTKIPKIPLKLHASSRAK